MCPLSRLCLFGLVPCPCRDVSSMVELYVLERINASRRVEGSDGVGASLLFYSQHVRNGVDPLSKDGTKTVSHHITHWCTKRRRD